MKKNLLLPLLILLATFSANAALQWYDPMATNSTGCLTTNPPSINLNGVNTTNFTTWYPHLPGIVTATDALVVNNTYTSGAATSGKRLRIDGTKTEYVMRLFTSLAAGADPNTITQFSPNNGTVLYASFVANANFVPAAGAGTYFAAFNSADSVPPGNTLASVTNGFLFNGRVFEIGNTNGNVYPFTNNVGGTFWYGTANGANGGTGDPAAGAGNINNIVFCTNNLGQQVDLKGNVDVQVVLKYDIDNAAAYIGINPASDADLSGPTSDGGLITNALAGFLFRQRTGGGTVDVRDIAVGTSFSDVMTNVLANTIVQTATNFNTVTNYPGTPALLEVFPTSIGGGTLSYQWYKISGGATNAVAGNNSQKMLISQLSASDAGRYFCAVTNSGGNGTTSTTNFAIGVLADAPLGFVTQAANTNVSIGLTYSLSCSVTGSGPYVFQWKFNGNPLTEGAAVTGGPGDASVASGTATPTLTVKLPSTNETGNFSVTVSNINTTASITSSNAHVTVNPITPVSIGFLRALEDQTTWQATDTTTLYAISNAVVTSFTNTSGVGGYYVQDATAGINLFVSNDPTFVPHMGDLVTAVGVLSSFNNGMELACFVTPSSAFYTPYAYAHVDGHTNLEPAPLVFAPYSQTNIPALMETNIEGRLVMITNVYFTNAVGAATGTGATTINTTNSRGETILVFFPGTQDQDIRSRTYPSFAWTITGIMSQFKSGAYSGAGYEVNVTRWGDIMTNPPPAVTVTQTVMGNDVVLTWAAVPYLTNYAAQSGAYAYSVYAATTVAGPYTAIKQGMAFNTPLGSYTDAGALTNGPIKYYRVSSP